MLKSLQLTHFTVFEDMTLEFSPNLNVIIGENGTGKTHCLKAGYAIIRTYFNVLKETDPDKINNTFKLEQVFQATPARSLCRHNQEFRISVTVDTGTDKKSYQCNIGYHPNESNQDMTSFSFPKENLWVNSIFIPSKEVLSMFPNFISLYEKYHLAFDETYYDLCKALDNPLLKKLGNTEQQLLEGLETLIGGKVILQGGQFYLQLSNSEARMEINKTAEGHRKLALLAHLLANDSIRQHTTLFWDEPESNLNPRLMRQVAKALLTLSKHGVQVILATHSYFFMKELSLLTQQGGIPARFFSLVDGENGVDVEHGEKLVDLQAVVSLDEELDQCDRDQALYYETKEPMR